jgi:hypothetical protein
MKTNNTTIAEAGRSFVEDLTTSARENPVSAALIAMGVLWMFAGSKNVASWAKVIPNVPQRAGEAAASALGAGARGVSSGVASALSTTGGLASEATSSVADGVRNLGSVVQDVGQRVTSGLDSTASSLGKAPGQVSRSIDSGVRSAVESGHEYATSLQENLAALFERQPLALGVIGVTVGAGIASSLAATPIENRLMGDAASSIKSKLAEAASDTSDAIGTAAKNSIEDIKREAQRQGITPAAARNGLGQVSEKIKDVAAVAQSSVRDRTS